jgi:hypothetical protein
MSAGRALPGDRPRARQNFDDKSRPEATTTKIWNYMRASGEELARAGEEVQSAE